MALEDRTRSQVMTDASPLSAEQISVYASLNPYTRSWETPREHVTIKQIVGKGAFGQVAKATALNLQGRAKKTLVAVKMLKGTKKKVMFYLVFELTQKSVQIVRFSFALFYFDFNYSFCIICKLLFRVITFYMTSPQLFP